MAVTFDKKLVIKHLRRNFLFVAESVSFLDFCKRSDMMATQAGRSVLDRQELEGAWVQELIYKFDEITKEDIEEVMGKPYVETEEDARDFMQRRLQQAVAKVSQCSLSFQHI